MANGDNIVAQAADGSKHVFPAGTDMSVVDGAMKKYAMSSQAGAMQSTPGGPVFSSKLTQPPPSDDMTGPKMAIGTVLGTASGLGIPETKTPVRDLLSNLFSSWINPSDPMATARQSPPMAMASGAVQSFGKATEAVNPLLDNFFRWLSNKTGGQQYGYRSVDPEQTMHDIAAFGTQVATAKGGSEGVEGVVPPVRSTLQRYLNIGPELTEKAVAERSAQVAEIEAANKQTLLESKLEHQDKVARAQSDYNKQVADIEQNNREALMRARSGYEAKDADYHAKLREVRTANAEARQTQMQKQQLMGEIQGHAQDLTGTLTELQRQTKQQGKAMYPEINGAANAVDVRNLVEDAITTNVRGTEKPPSMLGAMLKDLTPEDPLAQASVFRGAGSTGRAVRGGVSFMDLPPAARERLMPSLNPEERAIVESGSSRSGFTEAIDADRLHGYITELGEELQRDLSGDERAAITQTRQGLVGMLRKLADNEGKLGQFTAAQKNWAQYENTFNKTWSDRKGLPSPIAKALAAKDPVTGKVIPERAASILLKDLNYKQAQQMLGRYGGAGSDVLQLLKEKADQIATMPKSLKELTEPEAPMSAAISGLKEVPHEPLGPTMVSIGKLKELPPNVNPQELKSNALQETAQGLRSMKGIRAALDIASLVHFMSTGNPLSLAYPALRRGMSYGLEAPAVREYLTKPSPTEMTMISPRKVYPSKAAAMKATKGGLKGGINTSGYEASLRPIEKSRMIDSLSNEIDTMKEKLRNARDASQADRIALAKQISDYQSRLSELRGEQ